MSSSPNRRGSAPPHSVTMPPGKGAPKPVKPPVPKFLADGRTVVEPSPGSSAAAASSLASPILVASSTSSSLIRREVVESGGQSSLADGLLSEALPALDREEVRSPSEGQSKLGTAPQDDPPTILAALMTTQRPVFVPKMTMMTMTRMTAEASLTGGGTHRSSSPSSTSSAVSSGTSPRKRPSESPLLRPSYHSLMDDVGDHPTIKRSMQGLDINDGEEEEAIHPQEETTPPLEEFIRRECRRRGWGTGVSRPTSNPFVLYALCSIRSSPWTSRSLHLIDPTQLSCSLETTVYADSNSLVHALQFVPRPGDTIVTGTFRSGQTPLLQVVASLQQGRLVTKEALLECVDWLEAAHPPRAPSFHRHDRGGRLIKTHLPLRTAFGGVVASVCGRDEAPPFRVIVILRDPIDVRLSWFRHVRRVYRKFHADGTAGMMASSGDNQQFDAHIHVDDFASVHLYASNPNLSMFRMSTWDYEHFVNETIKPVLEDHNPQILLVHYEELLLDPRAFVQRVAEFLGIMASSAELIDTIASAIAADPDFPRTFAPSSSSDGAEGHRVGCSGEGRKAFSRESLRRLDYKWRDIVASHAVQPHREGFSSYGKLMESTSPILRDLLLRGSNAGDATHLQRPRTVSSIGHHIGMLFSPRGNGRSRLGSFFSMASSSGRSRSNTEETAGGSEEGLLHSQQEQSEDGTASEGEMSEGESTMIPTPSSSLVEQQHHQQHIVMALFPDVNPSPSSSSLTRPFHRSRTSSAARVGQSLRDSLVVSAKHTMTNATSTDSHHHLPSRAHSPPPGRNHAHHQDVDPDDTSDDDELNMFLDLKRSKLRQHHVTGSNRTRGGISSHNDQQYGS